MKKRIAIFGGSFDPIHVGHALVASSALRMGVADEVWFMVSPQNPLKADSAQPEHHRLAMAQLVASRMPGLVASDFEFSLPKPSYSISTLRRLRETYPETDFRLLIGADNWSLITRWKDYAEIVNDFGVIVYPRPGVDEWRDLPSAESLGLNPERVVFLKNIPQADISSTTIRSCLQHKMPITFMVDAAVEQYIKSNKLYRQVSEIG